MYLKDSKNKKGVKSVDNTLSYGETITVNLYKRSDSNSYLIDFKPLENRKRFSVKSQEIAVKIAKAIAYDVDFQEIPLAELDVKDSKVIKQYYLDNLLNKQGNESKIDKLNQITDNLDKRCIRKIFNDFVAIVSNSKAKNTVREYKLTISFLNQLSDNDCLLSNIKNLGNIALNTKTSQGNNYQLYSLHKRFTNIQTSLNYFNIKLDFNLKTLLPKLEEKKIKYYTQKEVKLILEAFKSHDNKSYYYPYVFTLANTGMRPEEAIALRIKDLKINSNGIVQISINKAYTDGELRNNTKTYKNRIIPCNKALSGFLIKYVNGKNKDNLLFPSIKDNTYLDQQNFNTRHFKPIMKEVCNYRNKEDLKDLTTYNLRHSFATNLLRNGVDIATIAGLLGDRVETVINNYIGSDYENFEIPDIY